ncbi:hypothetical protein BHE74_00032782 [Ensete ventricosum]|nr:hypothetical protein BHE74_00032782 [Ensete ventricosum]
MARHTHASYRCTGRTAVRLDCAQGMTEVRLNVRTSSSPIGIKPPISTTRQERTPFLSHSLSRSFFFLPSKGRRTNLHSPLTWASEGPHRANLPLFPTRPMCRTINLRAERDRRKDKPIDDWELTTERWIQPRSEIQILIDVGELAYSTENRSETQHTTSLGVMQSPSSLEDHERSYNDKARIVRDMPVRAWREPPSDFPFIPEIQDRPIPHHFWLSMLEAYDGGSDPTEHVAAFRTHMTLYGTSDAIMCRAYPTILRGIARGWYNHVLPVSIHSFDQLVREFKANFLVSARPKPTFATLLTMR